MLPAGPMSGCVGGSVRTPTPASGNPRSAGGQGHSIAYDWEKAARKLGRGSHVTYTAYRPHRLGIIMTVTSVTRRIRDRLVWQKCHKWRISWNQRSFGLIRALAGAARKPSRDA